MNNLKKQSKERKQYLRQIKKEKYLIFMTQVMILIFFLVIWELLAKNNIIDSFITSQPSRIWNTFLNLSSNDLLMHIWVTTYETIIGFLLGTVLGIVIAIILWWSNFLAKVSEPYLVVLNSLPKVALRTSNNYMGRSRTRSYNNYGSGDITCCYNIREFKWLFRNR